MNTGVVATRYARALLRYAGELPDGEELCREARALVKVLSETPQLRLAIETPSGVSVGEKLDLLKTSLNGSMNPSIEAFVRLVLRNGREKLLRLMLHNFVGQYFDSKNTLRAKLVTVVPSEKLEAALREMVVENTGFDVMIESSVDPNLIGGFVFTVENSRYDASVAGQLKTIHREFIENNKRII